MANRLFVTGDTHGDYDIGKLSADRFDSRKLDKDDYLIVAGDFGLVFHPVQSTGREEYWLRWLAQNPSPRCSSTATTRTSTDWTKCRSRCGTADAFTASTTRSST